MLRVLLIVWTLRRGKVRPFLPPAQFRENGAVSIFATRAFRHKKLIVPKFASEREEPKWWDANMDVVETAVFDANRAGAAKRLTPELLADRIRTAEASKRITVRVALGDIERARTLPAKRGLSYQSFLKQLLHEALDREEITSRRQSRRKAS